MDIFTIITISVLVLIFLEFLYSLYKKDGVFSSKELSGNLLTGLVGRFIFITAGAWLISFFYSLQSSLNYNFYDKGIISLITCLIIVDFLYYFQHKAYHSYGILWVGHSVHHSDNKFNTSLIHRISWVEQLYSYIFVPVLILIFPVYIVITCYSILGLYHSFTHDAYAKWPKFLNFIFVTPNNHRVHHDQELKHQNSNFGGIFSIWDRMFGTYVDKIDSFTPGIKGYKQDNFIMMQLDPVIDYFNLDKYFRKHR